ncbi:MAG: ATP-dependent DNA helicase RecG, partial [Bacteroidales bacterium]
DLLNFFPYRYLDKSNYILIAQIQTEQQPIVLQGKIIHIEEIGNTPHQKRLIAKLQDESGIIDLIWFSGIKWIKEKLVLGSMISVFGKPSFFKNHYNLTHPELEAYQSENTIAQEVYYPMYSTTEKMKAKGLNSRAIAKITENLCQQALGSIPEILPQWIIEKYNLISREQAYIHIHHPKSQLQLAQAQQRLKFEELFLLQMDILKAKAKTRQLLGLRFDKVGEVFMQFFQHNLKFTLTHAQEKVMKEIRSDTKSGHQMNRLLQGDVGSGKTIVALMCMLIAIDNGFQTCMMAPTEILARQHLQSFTKHLEGIGLHIGLLTGSVRKKERTKILEELANGKMQILIGTHALIEESVQFKNLGFVVIDEQHRFGVAQRAQLWAKNSIAPHILVMTATPIPRTLGMTLYGDLDVSVIDELPPNRKAIQTLHATDHNRIKVFAFMRKEIEKGRQIYVVYPLIHESEKLDLKDLMDGYDSITREFPLPNYAVSIVHGKMKAEVKDYEMQRFIKGETQIMVSTTVIEVGVDVPNASVMLIENSERFGMAQLHQLRGRVGRGAEQSYCILMTADHLSKDATERISTLLQSSDGFKIAEADLRLRGPGNLQGTQQSGILELKLADLAKDGAMINIARNTAIELLNEDCNLENKKNQSLQRYLEENKHKSFWAKIS